jgi:hypothetical protein
MTFIVSSACLGIRESLRRHAIPDRRSAGMTFDSCRSGAALGYGCSRARIREAHPMFRIGLPKLGPKMFSGWLFVLVAGVVLAVLAIIDGGGFSQTPAVTSDGSTGCRLEVSTDQLNVRAGPAQDAELLRTLSRGDFVDGTAIQTNLYRQLEDGSWAVTEFLTPVPGSNCT